MIVTHSTDLQCICPVNDGIDYYEIEITLDREVMVEDIRKVLALYKDKKATQESITQNIADYLWAKVTTRGQHSEFRTTCTVDRITTPPCTRPGLGSNEE